MTVPLRRVVLGLGNILNRDEGLGVHALALLALRMTGRTPFEFLDGGTLGLNLLPLVEETGHLLLLDAVDAGKPPGTIIELPRDRIPLLAGIRLSGHQVSFQEVLGLASVRGHLPEHLHLVGVQPSDLSVGLEMSDIVRSALPNLLATAERILEQWHLASPPEGAR